MKKIIVRFMVCFLILNGAALCPHTPICEEGLALETTSDIPAAPDNAAMDSESEEDGVEDEAPDGTPPADEEASPTDEEGVDEN